MELIQYMNIIKKKLWLILAIVVVACGGAAVKSYLLTTPIYLASAKLIVNQATQIEGTPTVNYSSVQTNIMLINSYKEIIRSTAITSKVVEQYPELRMGANQLARGISVNAASNSQVMSIAFQSYSYEHAANIVNAIAKVFKEQIPTIMKVDNVTLLNEANPADNAAPINSSPIMNILISVIVALLLGIGLAFLLDYLDDSIKSEEELERYLGLPVLASITRIQKEDMRTNRKTASSYKQEAGEGNYATLNQ
ncbi:YveK family protein [Paenibacillus sp. GCM10012307]|uniref:Lipopolysaccharide biosynthesis protein n=1 Tax=Paenibacillus roseus TaxID=2798579 RepID=A0A934J4N3_9BACL|nr:lipopolysaccharide biosynthesis protein [Paenibacillus roseus]